MNGEISTSVVTLCEALKNDPSYREAWKANIAMAYKDSEATYRRFSGKKHLSNDDKHIVANNAADLFLNALIS